MEANPDAALFARRNLQSARLPNGRIAIHDVGEWLEANAGPLAPVDLLVIDPPRTGVEEDVIDGILHLKPKRITYVSCDPATLARDLKALLAAGFELASVAAFDMFPQTHHVETVVKLNRADLEFDDSADLFRQRTCPLARGTSPCLNGHKAMKLDHTFSHPQISHLPTIL